MWPSGLIFYRIATSIYNNPLIIKQIQNNGVAIRSKHKPDGHNCIIRNTPSLYKRAKFFNNYGKNRKVILPDGCEDSE